MKNLSSLRTGYENSIPGTALQRPPTGRLGTASRLTMTTAQPPKTSSRFGSAISRQSQVNY